jgi:DNA polymerase III epsilon subunit-like protein
MKLIHALIFTVDTETTGPDPSQDRVVELGAAYLQAGQQQGPMLRALVDPGRYIPAGATQVHGIRNEDVEGAPAWPEVSARLQKHFERGPVLCGYNFLGFDGPLIDAENARNEIDWRCPRCLDPFVWIYWYDRAVQSKKLGSSCERYGVVLSEDQAHTADADAYATGLLLFRMVCEGIIPDDVELAFKEQDEIVRRTRAQNERFGRFVYPDLEDGRFRIGMGKYCGSPVDETDEGYLRWMLGRPTIPAEARSIILQALGQVEQIGLF